MKPTPIQIDPKAIKAAVTGKYAKTPKATFSSVLSSTSGIGVTPMQVGSDTANAVLAMGPAAGEFAAQATGGSEMAGAVLNAAFSGIQVAGGMAAQSAGGYASYGPYSTSPGVMGTPRYTTQTPVYSSDGITSTTLSAIDDPAQYQHVLVNEMNTNNLKLLELQALMQSNMQQWTTKSNILSADYRARMRIIEQFRASA